MSEEKQIAEMALILKNYTKRNNIMASEVILEGYAEELYNEGCRKQSEGEWRQSERSKYDYFCTVCGEKAIQNVYGNHDRLFKFCPKCGAKMKGGE